MAEGRLEYVPPRIAKGEQRQKDVKINGTNYLKSFRINESVKKTNSKRTVFCMKKEPIEVKKIAKSAVRSDELVHEVESRKSTVEVKSRELRTSRLSNLDSRLKNGTKRECC
jgi:hypothetical protein